jgi:hypothetical protein
MPLSFGNGVTIQVVPPDKPTVRVAPPSPASLALVPVQGPVGPQGAQGDTGPQGPAGSPGGSALYFTQSSPAATWIVTHNLHRKPQVSLFDVTATVIHADITHGSDDQTTITFALPTVGSALFS